MTGKLPSGIFRKTIKRARARHQCHVDGLGIQSYEAQRLLLEVFCGQTAVRGCQEEIPVYPGTCVIALDARSCTCTKCEYRIGLPCCTGAGRESTAHCAQQPGSSAGVAERHSSGEAEGHVQHGWSDHHVRQVPGMHACPHEQWLAACSCRHVLWDLYKARWCTFLTQVVQLQNLSARARGHHRRTLDALITSGKAYAAWNPQQRTEHLTQVEFAVGSLLWCVTS